MLQFTPTGHAFRERISKQKELLYLCQMAFMGDLPATELESLGRRFLKIEMDKAVNKAISLNK